MAGKYRRNRRTRKQAPKIRWTARQRQRLEDAIADYNAMVDEMEASGDYARKSKYGSYQSSPSKLSVSHAMSTITDRFQLDEYVKMVSDLATSDTKAVNVHGMNVPKEYFDKVEKYKEREKARRWNMRENAAEARGFESWEEMPRELQRALEASNNKLKELKLRGKQDEQLFNLLEDKWIGDKNYLVNYNRALRDNGYSDITIDIVNFAKLDMIMDHRVDELRNLFEEPTTSPAFDIRYIYRSDASGESETGAPYKVDFETREENIAKFWFSLIKSEKTVQKLKDLYGEELVESLRDE